MRILISNDDGIEAKGLLALVSALKDEHEIHVVAPASQKSAFSHSVTFIHQENMAYPREIPGAKSAWAIEGTPADCVYYGLHAFHLEPDLVVSGINDGPNMGTDILYSGTVGAAMEAVIHHVPAIAVSLCSDSPKDFSVAGEVARRMVRRYMACPMKGKAVLNINVPDLALAQIRGLRYVSPAGPMEYEESFSMAKENGGLRIASHGVLKSTALSEGTDAWAVENGFVAASLLESCMKLGDPSGLDLSFEKP